MYSFGYPREIMPVDYVIVRSAWGVYDFIVPNRIVPRKLPCSLHRVLSGSEFSRNGISLFALGGKGLDFNDNSRWHSSIHPSDVRSSLVLRLLELDLKFILNLEYKKLIENCGCLS